MGIMGNFWLLEIAEAESHGGFGINFDILETNLINLAILVGILVYFGSKVLKNILGDRQSRIAAAIQEAERQQKEAAQALAVAEKQLAEAEAEAQRIRQSGEASAKTSRESILQKATLDVERMQQTATQDLNTDRDKAVAELKERVAALAMQRVESQLKSLLNESTQQQLVDNSLAQLGGGS
jgi:F-type H+-transporting ATPase subunit b